LENYERSLCVATIMALSDWPREPVDAIFFHARAQEDDDGLFALSARLINSGLARFVAINGFDGLANAPGKEHYIINLIKAGVESSKIFISDPASNTKEENNAFLELSKENKWKSAVIISQPHQILRCFLGAVASMKQEDYELRLHAAYPQSTSWLKHVFGSQGVENKERFEHVSDELDRIPRYQEKSDLCHFEDFFEYIRNRERCPK